MDKLKRILFWLITAFLCFELLYGALWDFNVLNKNYVVEVLRHLGYPLYLAVLLGITKLMALLIILPDGFKLAKEWAYAGTFILFMGGFISHLLSGDTFMQAVFALLFAVFTLVSYVLRPQSRRLTLT